GVIEPARLPHIVLAPMRQDLNAPLGHLARLDPRDGEGCRAAYRLGLDRALHLHERTDAKPGIREPSMRRAGIEDRESRQMDAGVLCEPCIKLTDDRSVGRLEQHFQI